MAPRGAAPSAGCRWRSTCGRSPAGAGERRGTVAPGTGGWRGPPAAVGSQHVARSAAQRKKAAAAQDCSAAGRGLQSRSAAVHTGIRPSCASGPVPSPVPGSPAECCPGKWRRSCRLAQSREGSAAGAPPHRCCPRPRRCRWGSHAPRHWPARRHPQSRRLAHGRAACPCPAEQMQIGR